MPPCSAVWTGCSRPVGSALTMFSCRKPPSISICPSGRFSARYSVALNWRWPAMQTLRIRSAWRILSAVKRSPSRSLFPPRWHLSLQPSRLTTPARCGW
ncbi:hypothetical protein EJP617_C020 (plasmid) [Erwinia sp. Ejp617]|nr:hypothetical protein EJP617_C020 [Erwinia sp. Ejp617]